MSYYPVNEAWDKCGASKATCASLRIADAARNTFLGDRTAPGEHGATQSAYRPQLIAALTWAGHLWAPISFSRALKHFPGRASGSPARTVRAFDAEQRQARAPHRSGS
jgi:hypothetical protein